jgi:hypothetical protein
VTRPAGEPLRLGGVRTLLDERFAPITSSIGFLKMPIGDATDALERWRTRLYGDIAISRPTDGFPEALRCLEPLTGGVRPRELLVRCGDDWTAYFDCGLRGTDAVSAVGHLTSEHHCWGLAIDVVPHTVGLPGVRHGRMGAVQFELFGPHRTDFLNYVRTVSVAYDGGWRFHTHGQVQPFEEVGTYRARRVRDRFTSEMLERYCRAVGVDVFNAAAYGPDATLFESPEPVPQDGYVMTLEQVQEWLEIVPGMARDLPG